MRQLVGHGRLADRIRATDWNDTPVGPIPAWPIELRTLVEFILQAQSPNCLFWGDDGLAFYNDAWAKIFDEMHPSALGKPMADLSARVHRFYRASLKEGDASALSGPLAALLWKSLLNLKPSLFACTRVMGDDGRAAGMLVQLSPATVGTTAPRRNAVSTHSWHDQIALSLRLSDAFRRIDDPLKIEETATRMLGEYFAADRVNYAEFDCDGTVAVLRTEYVRDPAAPSMVGRYDLSEFGAVYDELRAGRPLLMADISKETGPVGAELQRFRELPSHAQLSVPILRSDRLVAQMTIRFKQPHQWQPAEVATAQRAALRTWEAVERAQAESALLASEERYRALVTATSEMIYRMSPDWNEMRELRGAGFLPDADEPRSDWLAGYIDPDDQPQVLAAIQTAIQTKGVFQLEHRFKRPDGTHGWAFSRAVPLLDAAGEIVEWFGAASDVTDRRMAEEAVRNAELRLRIAQEAAGVGTFDWIIEDNRGDWSPELLGMLGIRAGQFGGSYEDWIAMIHPDDRERAALSITSALELGTLEDEWRIVRPDGVTISVLVRAVLEHDARGRPVRLTGAQLDISERVRAEQRMKFLLAELDRRIEDLRRDLDRPGG